jgi:hypothetical protein
MDLIPIIFVHKGNPFYLKHALEQARIFNPDNPIYLIGDNSNKNFKKIEHYPLNDFFESAQTFQKIYKHQSPNSYDYELFCFQRWFIIKDFIEKKGITCFLYLDSDVLIYCNVDTVFSDYLDFDFTICDHKAPCTTLFNKESLTRFCDFINELYSKKNYLDILESRYTGGFTKNKDEEGNSDMTAFELYQIYKAPKVKELTNIKDNTCFDNNINVTSNFVAEKGIKKIYWINDRPHAKLIETQTLILFYSLHFQGKAKHNMYNYRIDTNYKHAANNFFLKIKSEFSFLLIMRIIKRLFKKDLNFRIRKR